MKDNVTDFEAFKRKKFNLPEIIMEGWEPLVGMDPESRRVLLDWFLCEYRCSRSELLVYSLLLGKIGAGFHKDPRFGYFINHEPECTRLYTDQLVRSVEGLGRRAISLDARGHNASRFMKMIGDECRGGPAAGNPSEVARKAIIEYDGVLIISNLSGMRECNPDKVRFAGKLIGFLRDGHPPGGHQGPSIIFADTPGFLDKAWPSLGKYLYVM